MPGSGLDAGNEAIGVHAVRVSLFWSVASALSPHRPLFIEVQGILYRRLVVTPLPRGTGPTLRPHPGLSGMSGCHGRLRRNPRNYQYGDVPSLSCFKVASCELGC